MNTTIESIKRMVDLSNGKPFTFNAHIKFNDSDEYEERKLCFAKPTTINRLAVNEKFDSTIFYYVSSVDEVKDLMGDRYGEDFKIISIIGSTMEIIDF